MADYGLLGGIGEGLSSFMQTYNQVKQRNQEQQYKNVALQLQAKNAGYGIDQNGGLVEDPEHKATGELKLAQANEGLDALKPDSDISKRRQGFVGGILNQAGVKNPDGLIGGMSSHEIDSTEKYLNPIISGEYAVKKERAGAGKKDAKTQSQALHNVQSLLESARGNPAAAQAEKDIYAGKKLKTLIGNYPDPNTMPDAQLHLLASEAGKIASGGVPGMTELYNITPHGVTQRLQKIASDFYNEPTPARAGAYIKEIERYANGLMEDAKGEITDKYGRVIESNVNQLAPDDYKLLQDQYINRFLKDDQAPQVKMIKGKKFHKVNGGWQEQ